MRDLASLLALGVFLVGFYCIASPASLAVRTAHLNAGAVLEAAR